MLLLSLILIPTFAGAAALCIKPDGPRRLLLVLIAAVHGALTATAWLQPTGELLGGWISLDSLGRLFLTLISLVFGACSAYLWSDFRKQSLQLPIDAREQEALRDNSEALFTGFLLLSLASMTLVTLSQHFGLLWMAIEATTLATTPLIYFRRRQSSLRTVWKYLLISSGGIALALLGNFLLAKSASQGSGASDGPPVALVLSELVEHAQHLDSLWLKGALLLFFVGYGTKIALAPLQTWLPDVQSASPTAVSALFTGAILNCGFLALLRVVQVCQAAGLQTLVSQLLIGAGLLSLSVFAVNIFVVQDCRRLLAYSSIGGMGLQSLGIGIGGVATSGSLLIVLASGLTRCMLCLIAGSITAAYRSNSSSNIAGLWRVMPWTGVLWLLGILSLVGVPPFASFFGQFAILKGAFGAGQMLVGSLYLVLLSIIFIGLTDLALKMSQGDPHSDCPPEAVEDWTSIAPPLVLCLLLAGMGVGIPQPLTEAVGEAALTLGGWGW